MRPTGFSFGANCDLACPHGTFQFPFPNNLAGTTGIPSVLSNVPQQMRVARIWENVQTLVLLLGIGAPISVSAEIVAQYSSNPAPDISSPWDAPGSLPDGWRFLWNEPTGFDPGESYDTTPDDPGDFTSNPFGNPSNYQTLSWDGSLQQWKQGPELPAGGDYNGVAKNMRLTVDGGIPGFPATDESTHDRMPVIAWSVPNDGMYSFVNGTIETISAHGDSIDGVELLIHINRGPVTQVADSGPGRNQDGSWSHQIGVLKRGDTIYLGLGAKDSRVGDHAAFDFQIEFHPTSIIDHEGDGMSDNWQRRYQIFSEDSDLDFDHDGFSNWEEAQFASDPRSPNSLIQIETVADETRIVFPTEPGLLYALEGSGEMKQWTRAPAIFTGDGSQRNLTFESVFGSTGAYHFVRLTSLGFIDMNADGVSDWEELNKVDFVDHDYDWLSDDWEQQIIDADPSDAFRSIYDINAEDDFDGDQSTNAFEFADGTNPTDPDDYFEPVRWREFVGTEQILASSGSQLIKVSGNNTWNADAISTKFIQGDGEVRFQFGQSNKNLVIGLSQANLDAHFRTLEYAFYGLYTGELWILERGVRVAIVGSYTIDDKFAIRRTGHLVEYLRNGDVIFSSTMPSKNLLRCDTSIYSMQAVVRNIKYSGASDYSELDLDFADADGDSLPNFWEVLHGLDPMSSDSAEDGGNPDPDADGLLNVDEFRYGSNPRQQDSNGNGFSDGDDVRDGRSPASSENGERTLVEIEIICGPPPPDGASGILERRYSPIVAEFFEHTKGGQQTLVYSLEISYNGDESPGRLHRTIPLFSSKNHYSIRLRITDPTEYISETFGLCIYPASTEDTLSMEERWAQAGFAVVSPFSLEEQSTVDLKTKSNGRLTNIFGAQGYFGLSETLEGDFRDARAYIYPIPILPDYNRDGIIDDSDRDQVDKDNPFRWWINDDDDEGEIRDKDWYNDIPRGGRQVDFANFHIDGIRDLVDFFPLFLDIQPLIEALPPEKGYTYSLKHEGKAFAFAELPFHDPMGDPNHDGPGSILRNTSVARAHQNLEVALMNSSGAKLSSQMLECIRTENRGILLVEALFATDQPITLKVEDENGDLVAEVEFPVQTSDVENMFRMLNLSDATGAAITEPSRMGEPPNWPDTSTNSNALCLIHGFESNLGNSGNQKDARGFHSELFKRFHQFGSNAKYVGITWNGTGANTNAPEILNDYHAAAVSAFRTSAELARIHELLPDSNIQIVAHSLGNLVTSNAIAHEGFNPSHYYMMNAAVPIEAFDAAQTNGIGKQAEEMAKWMTHDFWKPYYDRGLHKLFASEWHTLFEVGDARSDLTWKSRFEHVNSIATYNFYSTGEDVLENPDQRETAGRNLVYVTDRPRHVWVWQEIAKGRGVVASLAFHNRHGGWDLNARQADLERIGVYDPSALLEDYQPLNPQEASEALTSGALTDEELAQIGFFGRFRDSNRNLWLDLYGPIEEGEQLEGNSATKSNSSAIAADKHNAWYLLSTAIPARSYAVGANHLNSLGDRNYNMNSLYQKQGWPDERAEKHWRHDDFWTLAPNFVYGVYEKIIELGDLSGSN